MVYPQRSNQKYRHHYSITRALVRLGKQAKAYELFRE